ncbi:MAG TPA: twin-arginine translocation signal domain-containing protein [Pyrinomonadaceae bacterium]|nr:twin-arginine translocation signal domain-containing protein [Pyrinomonadaceae bacterium]
MTKHTRRDFIKQLGALAGFALVAAGQSSFGAPPPADNFEPFDFLVVGDSLVWGQGLREEHKFYYLTKQWLETEVFKNTRAINVKVKAHSGASLNLRDFEADALQKAEIGETEFYHPEVNVSFPSINAQIAVAGKEYENPESVDLIMLTGGITDIRLSIILNPLKDNDELRREIVKHCNEKVFELLSRAAAEFPNALIVVVGYYPFLSKYTPASVMLNNLLEIYEFPRPLKSAINNPLNRRLLKSYRKKMIERSAIWATDSTREIKKAVERLNTQSGKQRAVFVESPIKEENAIAAPKTLVYQTGKKGRAQDALAEERLKVCDATIDELKKLTDLKFRTRTCELATIGHPNVEGSKAIAEAIKESLKPFFQSAAE